MNQNEILTIVLSSIAIFISIVAIFVEIYLFKKTNKHNFVSKLYEDSFEFFFKIEFPPLFNSFLDFEQKKIGGDNEYNDLWKAISSFKTKLDFMFLCYPKFGKKCIYAFTSSDDIAQKLISASFFDENLANKYKAIFTDIYRLFLKFSVNN